MSARRLREADFERSNERRQFVFNELRDSVICRRCAATLQTYADICAAQLGRPCEGFKRIDAVNREFERVHPC